ncbi:MAG: nucleotidyltransferase domain-containing protein [Methyloprofundus sp.]|nr:nucleotidyltransferase domain-containing protein [Methyloprofundus sp.]MDT8426527.1 nucleotidyltransferase domain-containing protein [Methyloprofundus sp.]
MRLTPLQKNAICENTTKYFGGDAQVWLFGSRAQDHTKGGDIDLYIEATLQNAADLITAKLQFLRELHKVLGEQKIDVVLRRGSYSVDLPIYRIAKQTGILLK